MIGRNQSNANAIVQPIEYIGRPKNLGIGAKPPSLLNKHKDQKGHKEYEVPSENGGKNFKSIHE